MRANLESRLSLDDKKFRAGLRGAGAEANRFGKASAATMMKSVAAFAGATLGARALYMQFNKLRKEFDAVGKMATRFNVSVESLQRLKLAAGLTGSSIEKFQAALKQATVAGVDASRGVKTYADAFKDLNIDVAAFNVMTPEEKLKEMARGFTTAENRAAAFAGVVRILGRSGLEIIPLLRDMTGALEQAGEARLLSEEQVRRIEEMNDRFLVLSTTLKTDLMSAFLEAAPAIEDLTGKTAKFLEMVAKLHGFTTGGPIGDESGTAGAVTVLRRMRYEREESKKGRGLFEDENEHQKRAEVLRKRFGEFSAVDQLRAKRVVKFQDMKASGASDAEIAAVMKQYDLKVREAVKEAEIARRREAVERKRAMALQTEGARAAGVTKRKEDMKTLTDDFMGMWQRSGKRLGDRFQAEDARVWEDARSMTDRVDEVWRRGHMSDASERPEGLSGEAREQYVEGLQRRFLHLDGALGAKNTPRKIGHLDGALGRRSTATRVGHLDGALGRKRSLSPPRGSTTKKESSQLEEARQTNQFLREQNEMQREEIELLRENLSVN